MKITEAQTLTECFNGVRRDLLPVAFSTSGADDVAAARASVEAGPGGRRRGPPREGGGYLRSIG